MLPTGTMAVDEICYDGKIVLAPMVRVGSLPMRLLALDYGADIVYTEEIVDRRILPCRRVVNDVLNTVDFGIPEERYPVFRTCEREKGKVVFQMGTCDPEQALMVAKLVEDDVAAVDVNMGCPKSFSISGGMGAALLTQPEKIKQILSTLVAGIRKPVTCKIRILPKLEDTLALCSVIEKCGVSALAVHGRTKDERPRHSNHNDVIQEIARLLRIPVIANGGSREITCYEDIVKFRENTGAASVMVGRTAMWNASIFRPQGLKSIDEVIDDYLRYTVRYDNCPNVTKYAIQQILQDKQHTTERGREFLDAPPVLRDICRVWKLEGYCDAESARQRDRKMRGERIESNGASPTTLENENDSTIFQLDVPFIRKHFGSDTPKSILHEWVKKHGFQLPSYETVQRSSDKRHSTIVTLKNDRFKSLSWESSKRYSEQAAAFVALLVLEIEDALPNACYQDFEADTLQGERDRFRRLSKRIYDA